MCRSIQSKFSQPRQGAILPLVVIMLPVIFLLAGFVINVAYMELTKTELQISADAATRSGGRIFANTGDTELAKQMSRDIAALNTVAGDPLKLAESDFEFGISTRTGSGRYSFSSSVLDSNALRINARLDSTSPNGPLKMLLPNLSTKGADLRVVSTSTQIDLDIAIVVDRSGSMAYANTEDSDTFDNPVAAPAGWEFGDQVPTPSRWIDAEAALSTFLNELSLTPQTELVSLVTYGDDAGVDVPLTADYLRIRQGIRARGNEFEEAATNIGDGIAEGSNELLSGREFAARVILVLTDGINTTGSNPNTAAQRAVDSGTTVYTITFSGEANIGAMEEVADIGKGLHFHANSADELKVAFEEIAKNLPTLTVE